MSMTIQSSVKDKILATPSETSKYEYEIRYHPSKANVVTDALSRKERVKPRRVRAMAMTIQYGVREMILTAQSEDFKQENVLAERLHGLDQHMERKEDESLYFMDHNSKEWNFGDDQLRLRWMIYPVVLSDAVEGVRDAIGFEYWVASSNGWTSERMIQTLENIIRACVIDFGEIGESSLMGHELVLDTTDKVVLIKEELKSARDRQKSYADKRRKPLEFEILERIGPVAYRLRLPEELSGVHDTFHVSNLKKCLADANLHVPLNEIKIDKTLLRWNSKRGPEFTWEREDYMKSKYPQLFVDRAVDSAS
ncbi:hypothetical protein Tco_0088805 [Tanacetum coccineum]